MARPFALAFVIARLCHALGLTMSTGPNVFRFVGVMGTLGAMLGLATLIIIMLAKNTAWLAPYLH